VKFRKEKVRILLGVLFIIAGLFCIISANNITPAISLAEIPLDLGLYEFERTDGGYYTIVDTQGNILDKTVRRVFPGDQLISEKNRLYKVTRIEGDLAYAEFEKDVEIAVDKEWYGAGIQGVSEAIETQAGARNVIAIYHTHSAESFKPTDGTDSIPGAGGILKVGSVMAQKLQELGIQAVHKKTPHEPHDANAYRRSRRTAANLLAQHQPAAKFDVHRDGIPDPDFYRGHVHGTDVTRIKLVVGRQNQNMQSNLNFAKHLKAVNDKVNPGLIRSIFIARGNYNQDLFPRSLILEVGTYTNEREEAKQGAEFFAKSLPQALGIGRQQEEAARPMADRGDWAGVLWVLAISLLGTGAFLVISTGSFQGAVNKLKSFVSTEWANFLGKRSSKTSVRRNEDEDRGTGPGKD
jgi:stage II sporulation protein P